jgi:tetratricopeptide (TPR) repeat protein
MLRDNLELLLGLYVRPRRALSGILDEGSLLFALALVFLVSLLSGLLTVAPLAAGLATGPPRPPVSAPANGAPLAEPDDEIPGAPAVPPSARGLVAPFLGSFVATSIFGALFGLAVLYVPACIGVATFLAPVGSFAVAFRRDYGSLLVCALFSWAAAHLPFTLLGLLLVAQGSVGWGILGAWGGGLAVFAVFIVLSLRTVLGLEGRAAVLTAALAVFSLALVPIAPFVASPFLLYWGWQIFRGDVSDIQWSFGRRQAFKRHLQAATLNPRDAEAHYQLGLVYQHRRQAAEATRHFTQAVQIDPGEVDAHYQLGRIARSEKRYPEAIRHFEQVVSREPTHSRHEVWREIGATYAESGDTEHARWALEKYVAQRPHDPEGLCLFGEALALSGDEAAAREHFRRAVEAADTMPVYRRREVSEWKRRAKRRLG